MLSTHRLNACFTVVSTFTCRSRRSACAPRVPRVLKAWRPVPFLERPLAGGRSFPLADRLNRTGCRSLAAVTSTARYDAHRAADDWQQGLPAARAEVRRLPDGRMAGEADGDSGWGQ
jgi:hypothetical protein